MSSSYAIAAVTAVLRDLLNNGLNDGLLSAKGMSELGNVTVTALPPDRISTNGPAENTQLNVYMYHVTPNSGWRNMGMPSHSSTGERLTNAPLALDLHYIVSAYGSAEFHADALLGYALQLLHENPVITRQAIRATITSPLPSEIQRPPGLDIIFDADLADQIEQLKITPHYMTTEEISKLWMAFQAKYRPSAAYQVSVVLIEKKRPAISPLPVLKVGADARGPNVRAGLIPSFPVIDKIEYPNGQISALLGNEVIINGTYLTGNFTPSEVKVVLSNPFLSLKQTLNPTTVSNSKVVFTLPDISLNTYPAGFWMLAVTATPKDNQNNLQRDRQVSSQEVPFLIAPKITSVPLSVVANAGNAEIALNCIPIIHPRQRVTLALGKQEAIAETVSSETDSLTFKFNKVASGDYRVRLLVDGVESHLIDRTDPLNPKFDDTQKVTIT